MMRGARCDYCSGAARLHVLFVPVSKINAAMSPTKASGGTVRRSPFSGLYHQHAFSRIQHIHIRSLYLHLEGLSIFPPPFFELLVPYIVNLSTRNSYRKYD